MTVVHLKGQPSKGTGLSTNTLVMVTHHVEDDMQLMCVRDRGVEIDTPPGFRSQVAQAGSSQSENKCTQFFYDPTLYMQQHVA